MPKKKKEVKKEIQTNFEIQKLKLVDFEKILNVISSSENLSLIYEDKEVFVDTSKLSSKNNLKILNKKGEVIKSINYKDDNIEICGNKYDVFEILCLKKYFYLPITKHDGSIMTLIAGK
jgi:hypothetical protein